MPLKSIRVGPLSKPDPSRILLGERRLYRVLSSHGIALSRTLEQKISDAGPGNMRVDPHVLSISRRNLERRGEIQSRTGVNNANWYYLKDSPFDFVDSRYQLQAPIYSQLTQGATPHRTGQCLEIAVYRALSNQRHHFWGGFPDLGQPANRQTGLFSKLEPPSQIGSRYLDGDHKLDFLFHHPVAGPAGIEVKNVREWLYPDRAEIRDLLGKCIDLDCVPVLIARRFPYVTFRVLSPCGVIFHQNYNQLLADHDEDVATLARDKKLLGYHDIRVGNLPNPRLTKFIHTDLPIVMPTARERFDEFKDLLALFAFEAIDYNEFAARVRRRAAGEDEDADWEYDDSP